MKKIKVGSLIFSLFILVFISSNILFAIDTYARNIVGINAYGFILPRAHRIISTDGTDYYAQSGDFSQTITSTNATYIFETVSGNMTNGEKAFVKDGTYNFGSTWDITNKENQTWIAESWNTVLHLNDGVNAPLLKISTSSAIKIDGFFFDSNKAGQTSVPAGGEGTISIYSSTSVSCYDITIENCKVVNAKRYGIWTAYGPTGYSYRVKLWNNYVADSAWDNICLAKVIDGEVCYNKLTGASDCGVCIGGYTHDVLIAFNEVWSNWGTDGYSNDHWGIAPHEDYVWNLRIIGNHVWDNEESLHIEGSSGNIIRNVTVTANIFEQSYIALGNTREVNLRYAEDIIFSGNIIKGVDAPSGIGDGVYMRYCIQVSFNGDEVIDIDSSAFYLEDCSYCTIAPRLITNSYYGVTLYNCHNLIVENITIRNVVTEKALWLDNADNCTIRDLTVRNCTCALSLATTSEYNWVTGCDFSFNTDDVSNQGTETIWTDNVDRLGGFHETDPPDPD